MSSMSVGELYVKLGLDMSEFNSGLDRAEGKANTFGSMMKDMLSTAGGILLSKGIEGVSGSLTGAIGSARDFEKALSGVSAVAGGIAPENMEKLRQKALQIGADTSLSASQAVDAFEALVANGIDPTAASFNNIADSTVALAEATGGDLTTAANVATDTMANFGVSAEDMNKAVNGIVGVTVAGKFGIDDYRLAIANAGAVAGGLGVKLEDFNTVIAGTSSKFASGSDAGTSFKSFLLGLIPKTADAANAMRSLGLYSGLTGKEFDAQQEKITKLNDKMVTADRSTKAGELAYQKMRDELEQLNSELTKGENAFFNADGTMKDMRSIAVSLNGALGGLGTEQKAQALNTIFGTDAMRTALGVMDLAEKSASGTGTKFDELAGSIAKINSADQAKERLNNFDGAVQALQGSIETLSIVIGTPLINAFTPIVAKVTEVVNTFTNFTRTILDSANPVQTFKDAVKDFIPPGVIDGFLSLGGTIKTVFSNIVSSIQPTVLAITTVIAQIITQFEPLKTAFANIFSSGGANDFVSSMTTTVQMIISKFSELLPVIMPIITTLIDVVVSFGTQIITFWQENGSQIISSVQTTWMTLASSITRILTGIMIVIKPILDSIAAWWKEHGASVLQFIATTYVTLQSIFQNGMKLITEIIMGVLAIVYELWQKYGKQIMDTVTVVWNVLSTTITSAMSIINDVIELALNIMHGNWSGALFNISGIVTTMMLFIRDTIFSVFDIIDIVTGGALTRLATSFRDTFTGIATTVGSVMLTIGNIMGIGSSIISSIFNSIGTSASNAFQTAYNNVLAFFGRFYDAGSSIIRNVIDGFNAGVNWLFDSVRGALQNVRNMLPGSEPKDSTSPFANLGDSGRAVIENFQKGFDSVPIDTSVMQQYVAELPQSVAGTSNTTTTNTTTNAPQTNTYNITIPTTASAQQVAQEVSMLQAIYT